MAKKKTKKRTLSERGAEIKDILENELADDLEKRLISEAQPCPTKNEIISLIKGAKTKILLEDGTLDKIATAKELLPDEDIAEIRTAYEAKLKELKGKK